MLLFICIIWAKNDEAPPLFKEKGAGNSKWDNYFPSQHGNGVTVFSLYWLWNYTPIYTSHNRRPRIHKENSEQTKAEEVFRRQVIWLSRTSLLWSKHKANHIKLTMLCCLDLLKKQINQTFYHQLESKTTYFTPHWNININKQPGLCFNTDLNWFWTTNSVCPMHTSV